MYELAEFKRLLGTPDYYTPSEIKEDNTISEAAQTELQERLRQTRFLEFCI